MTLCQTGPTIFNEKKESGGGEVGVGDMECVTSPREGSVSPRGYLNQVDPKIRGAGGPKNLQNRIPQFEKN